MFRPNFCICDEEVVGIRGDCKMTRVKVYNEKTNKLNLKSPAHIRFLIEKIVGAHLFSGVYIKDPQAVIGLLKIALTCLEMEQQDRLEETVRELEQQLQTSTS